MFPGEWADPSQRNATSSMVPAGWAEQWPMGKSSPGKSACAKDSQMFNIAGPCSKERDSRAAQSTAMVSQYIPYVSSVSQD